MQPKILILDIETSPIISYTWALFDQNVALNQIKTDWNILSYSAKWLGDSKIYYKDLRNNKDITDDSQLLKDLWKLLDEAEIVLTQNGQAFDTKKINARFIIKGFAPPSSYRQIDTLVLAKKHFALTSNKLAYMSDKICKKYKKLEHKKFPGFELWSECLKGNIKAWKEMEKYNKHDVLSLEELYNAMKSWDNSINFNVYNDSLLNPCKCGSKSAPQKNGFFYTNAAKYQRYKCTQCGSETRGKLNLLSKDKKKALNTGTSR